MLLVSGIQLGSRFNFVRPCQTLQPVFRVAKNQVLQIIFGMQRQPAYNQMQDANNVKITIKSFPLPSLFLFNTSLKSSLAPISQEAVLEVLQKDNFYPHVSLQRQILGHVRSLILSEKLPAFARLPSMRELATIWGTSYGPVQEAFNRLASEGLIKQSTKKGSFVAPRRTTLKRVCIYHDSHSLPSVDNFYSLLSFAICRLLSIRGIAFNTYFDLRDFSEKNTIPEEIRAMVHDRQIDGVIAVSILPKDTEWLLQTGVPVATSMLYESNWAMDIDIEAFAEKSVELAISMKRKRIGFIKPWIERKGKGEFAERLLDAVIRRATRAGISVIHHEIQSSSEDWEEVGDFMCERLLKSRPRVDFILVYPDAFMPGVITSLVRHRISVPDEIVVVSHRNQELPIETPFPVSWLTVKIADFASHLLDQLERQVQGEKVKSHLMQVTLESFSTPVR